jgi:hypothetical protein
VTDERAAVCPLTMSESIDNIDVNVLKAIKEKFDAQNHRP